MNVHEVWCGQVVCPWASIFNHVSSIIKINLVVLYVVYLKTWLKNQFHALLKLSLGLVLIEKFYPKYDVLSESTLHWPPLRHFWV
jgi:hypothetical protein